MAILIDASYYLAISNLDDVHHKRAVLISEKIDQNQYGLPIITDDIFDEIVSVTLRKFGKARAQIIAKQLTEHFLIIHGTKQTFSHALKMFNSTQYSFSFTDCTSQAIMKLGNVRHIATFDKLFEKVDIDVVY